MSGAAFLFYSRRDDRTRIDSNSTRSLRYDLFRIRNVTFDSADQQPQPERHRVGASGHLRRVSASTLNSLQGSDSFLTYNRTRTAEPSSINRNQSEITDIRNNHLPNSVLQARARLVERLYLGGTRQRTRTGSISWATDSRRQQRRSRPVSIQEESNFPKNNKPPGLDQNSVNALPRYVFRDDEIERRRCSICLEKFKEGDVLIILPCIHKFHHGCLEPWITNRGDCPYCRTIIAGSSS